MTDPSPPALGYSTQSATYGGARDFVGTLKLFSLCLAAAAGAALVVAVALFAKLAIFLSMVAQALILMGLLMAIFHHLAIRQRFVLKIAAFATAAFSALLMQIAIYIHDVYEVALVITKHDVLQSIRMLFNGSAAKMHGLFVPHPAFGGAFLSNFQYRCQHSETFLEISVGHLVAMLFAANFAVRAAKKRAWCRTCDAPFPTPATIALLPPKYSERLSDAIRTGNLDEASALGVINAAASPQRSMLIAQHYRCKRCERSEMDVVQKVFAGNSHSVQTLISPIEVSTDFITRLRGAPVEVAVKASVPKTENAP